MKYRCFCHHKSYKDVTKDEAKYMLRSYRSMQLMDFVDFYQIPRIELRAYIEFRGMRITSIERTQLFERERRQQAGQPDEKDIPAYSPIVYKIMSYDVSEWPMALVCAIGGVSYDMKTDDYKKENRAYDVDEYNKVKNVLQNNIDNYFKEKPTKEEKNNLTTNDLVAMRYYRGKNRKTMAKLMGMNEFKIAELERTYPVSNITARKYKEVLEIKNAHIKQLRKIMKGTLDSIEEDRTIPSNVKVAVFGRDKGKCRHCNAKEKLHYHHVERFSEGGQNTIANLMLLCASCHAEEHKGEKAYYMLKKMAEKPQV